MWREGASIKENARQTTTLRTQGREGVSRALAGVREIARRQRSVRFTALLHHVTVDLLRDSFLSLKRRAAPGVDGVTWAQYEVDLEDRLRDLHERVHRGSYRAQPSRRTYIPKADGRQRPLGLAAPIETGRQDRAAAVVKVLESIHEEDFLGFSYGFRPGRSQHDALDALWVGLRERKVGWVLDADIRGFFDTINPLLKPVMAADLRRTPDRRSKDAAAGQEVAGGRSVRGREMVEHGGGDAAPPGKKAR